MASTAATGGYEDLVKAGRSSGSIQDHSLGAAERAASISALMLTTRSDDLRDPREEVGCSDGSASTAAVAAGWTSKHPPQ